MPTHQLAHAQITDLDLRRIRIDHIQPKARVQEVLPFRVKFTAIQIQAIGLGNTPAIPLQVIGYSNYIL